MTEFSTVVAAVGDSDRALDVIRTASTLARRNRGGTLFVAHAVGQMPAVMEHTLFPYACLGDDAEAVRAHLLQRAATVLNERWGKLWDAPAADILRVAYGHPAEAVMDIARALGPDLLVVGHGAGARNGALGPVGGELLERAAWPVWITRERTEPLAIRTVLVALDLTPDAPHLLTEALRLAEAHGAALVPIAVAPRTAEVDHAKVTGPPRDLGGKTLKQMEQYATRVIASMTLRFPEERQLTERLRDTLFVTGDPAMAICDAAAEHQADVVLIGRRRSARTAGLGRIAEAVARHAPCDVCVHPTVSLAASED